MSRAAPRVVLDTNTWLDLLWFRDPRSTALAGALADGRLRAVTSAECRDEWQRVLGYDALRIDADERTRLRDAFDACAQVFESMPVDATLPRCRDPDDQKFLELARHARASALFTRDSELLKLSRRLQRDGLFAVIEPWRAAAHFGWDASTDAELILQRPAQPS